MRAKTLLCPHCGSGISHVVDVRDHPYRQGLWRKRECEVCQHTFETFEQVTSATAQKPSTNVNM